MQKLGTSANKPIPIVAFENDACIDLYLFHDTFDLTVRGQLDAPAVMRRLLPVMASLPPRQAIRLDLSLASGMNMLALMALIGVLRGHCQEAKRIIIHGLPGWALAELRKAGPAMFQDGFWQMDLQPDEVSYVRSSQ